MTDDRLPMTREGYDKLKAELDRLRGAEMTAHPGENAFNLLAHLLDGSYSVSRYL